MAADANPGPFNDPSYGPAGNRRADADATDQFPAAAAGQSHAAAADQYPAPAAQSSAEPATAAAPATNADADVDTSAQATSDGPRGRSFTKWRKERPFGAGLCMILGGAVILTPTYLTIEIQGILINIATISGVSTLLIGVLLIVCGVLTWRGGDVRILTGVTALILAIVALPTSNFGGFILGTGLALVGGALALSWSPEEKPEAEESKSGKRRAKGKGRAKDKPKSKAEAKEAKKAMKADKAEKKSRRSNGRRGAQGAASIAAAVALVGAIAGTPAVTPPAAWAAPAPWRIPGIPDQLMPPAAPEGPLPAPALPGGEGLPSPSDILPDLPGSSGSEEGVAGITLNDPPAPREGELAVSDTMETITADSVRMLGNVRLSETAVTVPSGEVVQALRFDADRVVLDNLGLAVDGSNIGMTTGPGEISTLTGNFHIIVRSLTVTPAAESAELIPITIDARWIDDNALKALGAKSLGLPDKLSDELIMRNVSLETFIVRSDELDLPPSARIA
ncbi:DUF6114 domain-containing protein [Corynebacterium hansenii]|uniref:DUF6114 domain-containing protein n=1 Tax=Corynebacterium hansenii TaxID=394964 RepID=A0ABV7ZJK7_9CORY|nr:DUF6114 domain-containing protein [Corynebacterium hansenii]WJY99440.1 hypothetical protein CHAN_04085 [Corynebacterium hansenii]